MLDQLTEELKPETLELHELAVRVQQGDMQAFGTIYRLLSKKLLGYLCSHVRNKCQAEDLMSETFAIVLEKIGQYRGPHFQGWVFSIARNRVIKWAHATKREDVAGDTRRIEITDVSVAANPEQVLDYNLLMVDLAAALRTLTPYQWQCLFLYFFEERSLTDIAAIMSRSNNTVAALKYRALKTLTEALC